MSRPVSCATLGAAVTTAVVTAVTTVCSEISPKLRNDLIQEILGWI